MKKIFLSQGKFALVDNRDFNWLNQWRWHYLSVGYAARRVYPGRKYIYMHRLIMGESDHDREIDHINRNGLDNRRSNLRVVNRSFNMANTGLRSTNTSGAKGVYWDKSRDKWTAEITVNYKKKYLGRFNDKNDAALAYDVAAKRYFGQSAFLNSKI